MERIIGIYQSIPPEEFERLLPSWIEKIHEAYPVSENIPEWSIDIEHKNGVPIVKNLIPKARIIRLFWQKHKDHTRVLGMRVKSDRLVFHLRSEKGKPHDFAELLPEMEKWMPLWAEHFGLHDLNGIVVEYYNVLDGHYTPHLIDPETKSILLGESLTVFGKIPGKFKAITDPYDCKVRLVIDDVKPTVLDFRVRGDDQSNGAIRVDFIVSTFPSKEKLPFSRAIGEINAAHDVIIEQFACVFTEKAKNSFNI